MHIQKKCVHKYKEALKAHIVTMHDPDRVKKFSALMQSISAFTDTSASKSWPRIRESIYQTDLEFFKKKRQITIKDCFEEYINILLPFG